MSDDKCRDWILSEQTRDFIVSELQKNTFEKRFGEKVCTQSTDLFYQVLYADRQEADPVEFGEYPYNSVPKCYTLLDMEAMEETGILNVQNYPSLELQGSGVMIGFVDTGIDYQNPVFRNLDGSTRIVGIWDQTIQDGPASEGFSYGSEYGENVINQALKSENPLEVVPSKDEISHGTFVAGLAAGGGDGEHQFVGGAPESYIGVVKLKPAKEYLKEFYLIFPEAVCYQENDIMLGVAYLNRLANRMGVPLVLCLALGTNQGGHSGGSALSELLDICGNIGNRAIVIGAGNEGAERHHYLGSSDQSEESRVEVRVGENTKGFSMEMWTDASNLFAVSVLSPGGEKTYEFPVRSEKTLSYTFVPEQTQIKVDYKIFAERLNAQLIHFRVINPVPGVWTFLFRPAQTKEGIFHLWLPVKEFISGEVFFLKSDPDYTLTEPGSTLSAMTVGFYDGKTKSVAISSGRGYTRGGRIKPDFVAPGVNVLSVTNRNLFTRRSGSSVAAGITAGAAALMMEWAVYRLGRSSVDTTQVRNLLLLGTEKNQNLSNPNRLWGYGRLDLYGTFEAIRRI